MGMDFGKNVSWDEESATMAKAKNYKRDENGMLVLDENGNMIEILEETSDSTEALKKEGD